MNALQFEKSPYLLQHATNPVDWHPWGEDAFRKAYETGRPIFLSIGYSTCHWCHVMEHESFEDPGVASLMNDAFVCVKVDREERPDVDAHYMTACQLITGSGGWPLTIVMTPEGTPFFAGTYFPKESGFGHVGMLDLVPRIRELWETRKDELVSSSATVAAALSEETRRSKQNVAFDRATVAKATQAVSRRFDSANGGFGSAPKFPMASVYPLLLKVWRREGDAQLLAMVERTLRSLRNGGIYDQVGFGFHRYSTDAEWRVPHFEKMLYDQALLCIAYVEAWRATADDFYRRTAQEICRYVLRDMTAPEGGLYTAEDADSEGEEGRFYLWTKTEIEVVLSPNEQAQFAEAYTLGGGEQVTLYRDPAQTKPPGLVEETLYRHRQTRQRPSRDDKILTDWNGLMIAALARAGCAFSEPSLCDAAEKAADFLMRRVVDQGGRLLHRFRDGEAAIAAFADDYLFLIWGLLELYEATFKVRWLGEAVRRMDEGLARFWDIEGGGFFQTAHDTPGVPGGRMKPIIDNVIPSANSVAVLALTRLAEITGQEKYRALAGSIISLYPAEAESNPLSFSFFLSALDFFIGPTFQVVIAADSEDPYALSMARALRSRYLPNVSVVFRPIGGEEQEILHLAPYTASQGLVDDKATAYVCSGWSCMLPTNDPAVMLRNLAAE
jgi:hypothetical protein